MTEKLLTGEHACSHGIRTGRYLQVIVVSTAGAAREVMTGTRTVRITVETGGSGVLAPRGPRTFLPCAKK